MDTKWGKWEWGELGDWDWHVHSIDAMYKIEHQWKPTVEHKELYLTLCGDLNGKGIQKRGDICICMADSPCCTTETDTIFQSNYAPININLKKINRTPVSAHLAMRVLSHFSCVWLFATSQTIVHQGPLSMGFPRQEYWSGLPFPSPGDLLNPGIEPRSPALQVDSLPLSHLESPITH